MKVVRLLKREFLHVFPVFLFFFVFFNFINITEESLFRKAGIPPYTFVSIGLSAALIAKILLVVDHLPFLGWLANRPLLLPIAWKTGVYWVITLGVRVALRFLPFLWGGLGLQIDLENFVHEMDWRLFAAVQAWYLMLFFIFVTGRELSRVLGYDKVRYLFLGR